MSERLKEQRGIALVVTPAAKKTLAHKGYDPAYGARPLKRVIQSLILNPLSLKIMLGEIEADDTIQIGARGDEILLTKPEKKVAALS